MTSAAPEHLGSQAGRPVSTVTIPTGDTLLDIPQVSWDPDSAWQRYCGFLDLSVESFKEIQAHLLIEQIRLLSDSRLGRRLLRRRQPASVEKYRETVPITTYGDYLTALDPNETQQIPAVDYLWAHTTGAQARYKYVPYTRRAYLRLLDNVMAGFILSAARDRGDVRVRPGDMVMYNVPPRPYLSGHVAFGIKERFGMRGILEPDVAERMEFKTKVRANFEGALRERVDLIISMTSVLVRAGESFEQAARTKAPDGANGRSGRKLNWRAASRIARSQAKSLILRRPMRAGDLWPAKGIIGWGVDTSIFSERVNTYWGRRPFELYACTEGGVMGMQTYEGRGLVLNPYSAFYEFIPESDSAKTRHGGSHNPAAKLIDQVAAGQTYELVISSYYGMPFMRYRLGHFLRCLSAPGQGGRPAPEFEFLGRADDRIDIAGFTRVDEKTLWEAIQIAELPFSEWTVRAQPESGRSVLHVYAEARDGLSVNAAAERLHKSLKEIDAFYADLDGMLDIQPLRVTLLSPGTFDRYYSEKHAQGLELTGLQPPRMNPSASAVGDLLRLSETE